MALFWRTPCPPLSGFVKTIWLSDAHVVGPHLQERILPTGECSLVLDLRPGGTSIACGPYSDSFVIDTAAQYSVAGVQFLPAGARPFFDGPIAELANTDVRLAGLWGRLAGDLRDQVLEAPTPERRLLTIERVLLQRLARGRPAHAAVIYAVGELQRGAEAVRVEDIIRRIGVSHRRFLDLFTAEVGLTPKRFHRIRRFQRVLQQVREQARVNWMDVALSCGYYDQAHFIKEFSAFSGVSPSVYEAAAGAHANHLPLTG